MGRRFELTECDNGGWIITHQSYERGLIQPMSAYSTTGDMMKGLADKLAPPPEKLDANAWIEPGSVQFIER